MSDLKWQFRKINKATLISQREMAELAEITADYRRKIAEAEIVYEKRLLQLGIERAFYEPPVQEEFYHDGHQIDQS